MNISLLTRSNDRTEQERRMMKRAGRVHGLTALGSLILVSLITWGAIEGYGTLQASALVESLLKVGTPDVPAVVKQLSGYRRWADPRLVRAMQTSDDRSRADLHASLALLPVDETQVDYLFNRLERATAGELPVLRDALKAHGSALTGKLWTVLESAKAGDVSMLPSASALACYAPDDPRWEPETGKVARALVSVNSLVLGTWLEALRPVRAKLSLPLTTILEDKSRSESEHSLATDILTDFARDDPDMLAELLMVAEPKAYSSFFPFAGRWAARISPVFRAELSKRAAYSWDDPPIDRSRKAPDAALVRRIESAQGILAERFAFCQTLRLDELTATAVALGESGYRPVRLRPYADGRLSRVAAVWIRDGRAWRISSGLTAEGIRLEAERNGAGCETPGTRLKATSPQPLFLPVDVAGYVTTDNEGKLADRYSALWVENSGNDDARLYVGVSALEQDEIHERLKEAGQIPRAQTATIVSDGRQRYSGVWGRPPRAFVTGQTRREQFQGTFQLEKAKLSDDVLLDVAVNRSSSETVKNDDADSEKFDDDFDLDPIRQKPAFAEIMNAGHSDPRYSTVWNSDPSLETLPIFGLDPAAQLEKCRILIAQGYRPVSFSASRTTTAGPLVTASVWQRPVIAEETRDRLAERQARAAVALVRLDEAAQVWPLLRHSADPRLRSFIVNWLSPLGADPKQIATELDRLESAGRGSGDAARPTKAGLPSPGLMDTILFHPETSQRRALILALGTYGTEGLSAGEREPLIGKLLDLYRNDPDSGIHGAAEWALRQWKQHDRLQEAATELMRLKHRGNRRWYVNSQHRPLP